jgi:hypothetical protein
MNGSKFSGNLHAGSAAPQPARGDRTIGKVAFEGSGGQGLANLRSGASPLAGSIGRSQNFDFSIAPETSPHIYEMIICGDAPSPQRRRWQAAPTSQA